MKINAWIAMVLTIAALVIGYISGHRTPTRSLLPTTGFVTPIQTVRVSSRGRSNLQANPPTTRSPRFRVSARDLFGPQDEAPASVPTIEAPARPMSAPIRDDPLRHYTYTGSAQYGNQSFAMLMDDRTKSESMYSPGDTVEGYTIASILPEAVTLRLGKQDRRLAVVDQFNPVPMVASAPKDVRPNPGNLTEYRDKTYQSFFFQVTGAASGSIWGSGSVYTDDSALATAAVHSGALKDGESGVVRVTVLPGYDHYDGATSNGVTSQSYAQWQGSYRVDRL